MVTALLLAWSALAVSSQGRPQAHPPRPVLPPTCEGMSDKFVAYNRCTWLSIVEPPCPGTGLPDGILPIDSSDKKIGYRFTLSPAYGSRQTLDRVWLFTETAGSPGRHTLSVREDADGVPGLVRAQAQFFPPADSGPSWQLVSLPSGGVLLDPGRVYHLVVESSGSPPSPTECLKLASAVGRFPVRYVPTDGGGMAKTSPPDAFLATMTSSAPGGQESFLVEAGSNIGITPIFLLDLGSSLSGQPYDEHIEKDIYGLHEYGQRLTLTGSSTRVNYASFWVRGMTCPGEAHHPPQASLLLQVFAVPNTTPIRTAVFPASQYYFGRPHWFGAFFEEGEIALPAGTYDFVLSSPDAAGPGLSPNGWVFSAENSTPPPKNTLGLPTYGGTSSYAIESADGGASFGPVLRNSVPVVATMDADAGFLLGYFPEQDSTTNPLVLSSLCDSVLAVTCPGTQTEVYPKTMNPGQTVTFSISNRNIGQTDLFRRYTQYMRLLDFDCNQLVGPVECKAHTIQANVDNHTQGDLLWTWPASSMKDAYWFRLEIGHFDSVTQKYVADQFEPFEIRRGCPAGCNCP